MNNGKHGDLKSTYEENSTRAERFAFLILVGLALEIISVFVLSKSLLEALLTIGSTTLILAGVWGEIFFERRAREAGDRIVAEANARAAGAQLELARFRRPRVQLLTPEACASIIGELSPFAGTSTRNHSWVTRRFLNRRWRTLFLVQANGVAVSL